MTGWTEILNQLAITKKVEGIVKTINSNGNYTQDLIQDIYLILLEKEPTKMEGLYQRGELDFFIARIAINQIKSSSSETFQKYRKTFQSNHTRELYNFPPELEPNNSQRIPEWKPYADFNTQDLVLSAITYGLSDWYPRSVCTKYFIEKQTLKKISTQTKIPISSLHKTITSSKPIIKLWIQNHIANEHRSN
jgi:hypothetical protein